MRVTRTSPISGVEHTMDLPNLTEEKFHQWNEVLENDEQPPLIQQFFPELTDSEREFLLSGITPEEWEEMFLREEEDEGEWGDDGDEEEKPVKPDEDVEL